MSAWTYLLAILPGIFAGLFLISRVSHLLQAFIKADAGSDDEQGSGLSMSASQIFGVATFVVSWVGVFGAIAYYMLTKENSSVGLFWFFVGMTAAPCIALPPIVSFMLRAYGRRETQIPDALSQEHGKEAYDYAITLDENYIGLLIQRYLDQDLLIGRRKGFLVLFVAAGVVIWVFDLFGSNSIMLAIIALITGPLSAVILYYVQRKVLYSDLAYGSHMGMPSTYRLSSDGLEVDGPRPYHEAIWPDLIEWPNILRATRFNDGVFLWGVGGVTETFALVWLPDSALVDANADRVSRFVERKMQPRSVRRMK